jgi:hypothetical protein
LRFIPPPSTNLDNLELALGVVLPDEAAAADASGRLVFHTVGDTGGVHGDDVQKAIASAMDAQRSTAEAAKQPAPGFFYNLGDVVYFNGLSTLYDSQFYEPYQDYHAAIFAIAGNHDGDTRPSREMQSIRSRRCSVLCATSATAPATTPVLTARR